MLLGLGPTDSISSFYRFADALAQSGSCNTRNAVLGITLATKFTTWPGVCLIKRGNSLARARNGTTGERRRTALFKFCRLLEHRFKLIRHVTPLLGKVEVP
jgi:hypothetical protein